MNARVSVKVVTSGFLEANEFQNLAFLRLLFQNKNGGVWPKKFIFLSWLWNVYVLNNYRFSGSEWTCFIEISQTVLLEVNEPQKINIFEAIIVNQKRRNAAKVIHVFEMALEGLYLLQLYINSLPKSMHLKTLRAIKNNSNLIKYFGCVSPFLI